MKEKVYRFFLKKTTEKRFEKHYGGGFSFTTVYLHSEIKLFTILKDQKILLFLLETLKS